MPVKSTYIRKNESQSVIPIPFDFHFIEETDFQIPKSVHGKNVIQSVQCYDENEEFIEPPIRIEHSTGMVYVLSSVPITGKVRIF